MVILLLEKNIWIIKGLCLYRAGIQAVIYSPASGNATLPMIELPPPTLTQTPYKALASLHTYTHTLRNDTMDC